MFPIDNINNLGKTNEVHKRGGKHISNYKLQCFGCVLMLWSCRGLPAHLMMENLVTIEVKCL